MTLPSSRKTALPGFGLTMGYTVLYLSLIVLLPLAALAFAIPPKRSTSALGVFLSIVFIVTYHKINQYAEALGSSVSTRTRKAGTPASC